MIKRINVMSDINIDITDFHLKTLISTTDSSVPFLIGNENKKIYQNWKGNNVFLCQGSLMLGSNLYNLVFSMSILILSWILFFTSSSFLLQEALFILVGFGLMIINILTLTFVSFTEPGIQPREYQYPLNDQYSEICKICNITKNKSTRHCKYCNNCVIGFDHHCQVSLILHYLHLQLYDCY